MEVAVKKEIGIDIFTLSFTGLLFWSLMSTGILINNPLVLILLILVIPVWVSCLAIALAFVGNRSAVLLSLLIPVILVLFDITQIVLIAAAIIISALLASARFIFVHELKSRVEYKTRHVFYLGTKLLVMAIIIIITGISMPHITQSIMSDEAFIPESVVSWLIKPYEPYIAKTIPGGSLDVSFEQVIDDRLQQQYPGNPEAIELQKEIISGQLSKQLSNDPQQEPLMSEEVSSVAASVLNNQIRSLTNNFPIITPIAIFAIVILVSRFIIPILTVSLLISIASLVWLSRKCHLVKLLSVSKPVEHLEL